MTKLSVVIPTLNEAERIEKVLDHALAPGSIEGGDIVVVDGGSHDGTIELAQARVRVIASTPGRAAQMNEGARQCSGDQILFCHSDSLLPADYPMAIERALADPKVIGGGFTPSYRPRHFWLTVAEKILMIQTTYLLFGDSALFFRRRDFEAVGGYPEVPLMEEVVLIDSLRSRGRIVRLPETVITSSRRFMEHGVFRQLLLDIRLLLEYHLLDRSPEQLAPDYWQTERDRPTLRE